MLLSILQDATIPIVPILLGILLAILCLGIPLSRYKGHWSQWSMSSKICLLLLFALAVGIILMCQQYLLWIGTLPDFIP